MQKVNIIIYFVAKIHIIFKSLARISDLFVQTLVARGRAHPPGQKHPQEMNMFIKCIFFKLFQNIYGRLLDTNDIIVCFGKSLFNMVLRRQELDGGVANFGVECCKI